MMNWLYYFWCFAFTSGRVYGKKGAAWMDERPIFISDLHRFKGILEENKSSGTNLVLRKIVERAIKEAESS